MEFEFDINNLFPNTISYFGRDLQLHRNNGDATLQKQLASVIDAMGMASAKAQGLGGAITTAYKMKYSDHHLYVMKESQANSGKGSVVGILKMGRKVLFVLDHHSKQIEMRPMCVLDFYVHESCQRRGHGKQLFQHMLSHERIEPQHLAIDRPSKKFTSFLMKHYRLRAPIPQVNNFVIFEGFFKNQPEGSYPRRRSSNKPPLPPSAPSTAGPKGGYRNASDASLWGRKSTSRPSSKCRQDSGNLIERAVLQNVRPRSGSLPSSGASPSLDGSQEDLDLTTRGLSYSRHHRSATPPSRPGSGTRPGSGSRPGSGTRPSTGSRPGSGKGSAAASPITGSVTKGTNSPPVTTTANSTESWEDVMLRRKLPLREHNSAPLERPSTRGASWGKLPGSTGNHVVDSVYDGIAATAQPTDNTMHSSRLASGVGTTHPTNTTSDIPTAATNGEPTKDMQSSGSRYITKEGNYCMTSYVPRSMPSSWNVLGVLPSPPPYDTGQSGSLHRNSNYRTNRFF